MFSEAAVRYLSHLHLDHCPLFLGLKPDEGTWLGNMPFQFLDSWLSHINFLSWVEGAWSWNGNLVRSLNHFSEKFWHGTKILLGTFF